MCAFIRFQIMGDSSIIIVTAEAAAEAVVAEV